jgi:hypothetical protein
MSVDKIPEPRTKDEDELSIDTTGMSEGKRQALEVTESAREADWKHPSFAGELFMGRLRYGLVSPFPAGEIVEEGERFLADMTDFLARHADPDEIDRRGEVPDEVLDGLRDLGAFGIKISKEHGGLGLSQSYYTKSAAAFPRCSPRISRSASPSRCRCSGRKSRRSATCHESRRASSPHSP